MPTCSICLEGVDVCRDVGVQTDCCHSFHAHCLGTWFGVRQECPSCRHALLRANCHVLHMTNYLNAHDNIFRLNHIQFRASNAQDLKVCILFLFFTQHYVLLPLQALPSHTEMLLDDVAFDVLLALTRSKQCDARLHFPRFYGQRALDIHVGEASSVVDQDQDVAVSVEDLRTMFVHDHHHHHSNGQLERFHMLLSSSHPTDGEDR